MMKNNEIHNPLVSIVVITYNSAKYVLETLESAKSQTYQNIELIVSDDCSTDDTVVLCRDWIEKNKGRFVRTKLIESEMNTGISANCNRGYNAVKGEWIKGIAGDDVLRPNCITDNVIGGCAKNVHIQMSKVEILDMGKEQNNTTVPFFYYHSFLLAKNDFILLLLYGNFLPAATSFISTNVFRKLGGFDETIPMMEDWPFWIKAVMNGYTISFMDSYTVLYRIHPASVSNASGRSLAYRNSMRLAWEYALIQQKKKNRLLWVNGLIDYLIICRNYPFSFLLKTMKILNPMTYYIKFLRWKISK